MGYRHVLVNHTRKVIMETSLHSIWQLMNYLIQEEGWEKEDDVEMMFEDGRMEEIGKLVVIQRYKSHYDIRTFDYMDIIPPPICFNE